MLPHRRARSETMWMTIAGLLLFLGVHSTRLFADDFRTRTMARIGAGAWKGAYALVAIAGFVLLVLGYGRWRMDSATVWSPPIWTYHLAPLLTLLAFVLVAAAYVPRNRLRARLGHPMLLGTKAWALAHLLSNGRVADIVLFGAFLGWAVADFVASRRRDRRAAAAGTLAPPPAPRLAGDLATLVAGAALWALFAFWLHARWIGIDPMALMRAAG